MPDDHPEKFQDPKRWVKTLPQQIWKGFLDHIVAALVGAIVMALGMIGLYTLELIFQPAKRVTVAQQNSLGAYCLNSYFTAAETDGARLNFDPAPLRNIAICGQPPLTQTSKDRDALPDVFRKLRMCFDAKAQGTNQLSWKVLANETGKTSSTGVSGQAVAITKADTGPLYACKCSMPQMALMAENAAKGAWCGLTVDPDDVRPEFRDVRIQW